MVLGLGVTQDPDPIYSFFWRNVYLLGQISTQKQNSTWQQLPVSSLCATRIRMKQMPLLKRIWYKPKGALPGALQQVQGPLHSLPMLQVEKGVRQSLAIASLQNVLRWQDEWLHFEQILGHMRIELNRSVYRIHCAYFRRVQPSFAGYVRRKLVTDSSRFQQRSCVANCGWFWQIYIWKKEEKGVITKNHMS